MHLIDAWVKIKHPCPFCDFSARYPEAGVTLWPNILMDIVQVSVPVHYDIARVLVSASEMLGYTEEFHDEETILMMVQHPLFDEITPVISIAAETQCLLIAPITLSGGWETHRVVCREQGDLRRFVSKVEGIGGIELLSQKNMELVELMRDVTMVPTHFIDGLTDKQATTLVIAYEQGLLDVPARTGMDEVAAHCGLSRSTFGEHLRKAELQVMTALYPFLKLRCCRDSPACVAPSRP